MEVRAFDVDKLVNRLEEAELYTNKCGTFAKSDFELMMFTIEHFVHIDCLFDLTVMLW